ncbi:MAG TPA: glucan biosynthesis protein [Candidatus Synoicihabitans sp.]|nr:glucan biosynthesis protein [Candidatus Synoicihabitans sp.]
MTIAVARADVERVEVNFDYVQAKAEALAKKPYRPPDRRLPGRLANLTYDEYRSIRFKPEEALWRDEKLPFQLQFFHRGGMFHDPVALYEFSPTHAQDIPFLERFFDYSQLGGDLGWLRSSINYAGFRVHYPLNRPEYHDEILVFLGASYFRSLAAGQVYGLSARGLALDSGINGVTEEFPRFSTFWIGKPQLGDTTLRAYALLDSQRVAGAYEFVVNPGRVTLLEVRAVLFYRDAVGDPGWAPLTSMFWYGENTDRPTGEMRPEVHDSDGLILQTADGGTLWRPLHSPNQVLTTDFPTSQLQRFGLLQRDRSFASFEDPEAEYHRRPSAWVEPKGDWGSGRVRLIELPADKEYGDNIVALWRPDAPVAPGVPVEFSYRLVFGFDPPAGDRPGRVVATRNGAMPGEPTGRIFWIDFEGEGLEKISPDNVGAAVEPSAGLEIKHQGVVRLPNGRGWRAMVQVVAKDKTTRADLRCTLRDGYDPVSETWSFAWLP